MRTNTEQGTPATPEPEDLEALFDSIVMQNRELNALAAASSSRDPSDLLINRIGQMARTLHDTLQKLGYDKSRQKSTALIPNAYDRLHYIASLTEQAADRILHAAQAAQAMVVQTESESMRLADRWQLLLDNKLDVDQFRHLVEQTRHFLADTPARTRAANARLEEIVGAQGTREMAGQLIKQIVDLMQLLEKQLLELLIANPPSSADHDTYAELLSRPDKRVPPASGHDQIDELLDSLGF